MPLLRGHSRSLDICWNSVVDSRRLINAERNKAPSSIKCSYELAASRLLCELALITGRDVGKDILFMAVCLTFAQVKTMPLTKPIAIAETLPKVTGASKKTRPLTAIGSLFKDPTIEYVVDDVTRIHQAEQYEMKMVARPE